jgi:GAF domain-containing protein
MNKAEKYQVVVKQINALPEMGRKERLQKIAQLLQESFGFWWTGFYFVETMPWIEEVRCDGKEEEPGGKGPWLILGPNVGPPACERISFGRGVCGTAWKERKTIIVPDVDEFPGHIACSSESRSEIVVPVFIDNEVAGVLDIDSRKLAAFDEIDAEWLQQIVGGIG